MERIRSVILLACILLVSGCDKLWQGDDITNELPTELEAVDLGLPSGTLWGSQNLTASRKWDFGCGFTWGETEGREETSPTEIATDYSFAFDEARYFLDPEKDAASVMLGEGWRMPTRWEFKELLENCRWESKTVRISDHYISGYNVSSKVNSNSIFIPILPKASVSIVLALFDKMNGYSYWTNCSADNEEYAYCFSNKNGVHTELRRTILMVRPVYAPRVPVEKITLEQKSLSLPAGSVYKMEASIQPLNALDKRIIWTLSDGQVAKIDENGNFTALSPGETRMTASSPSGLCDETVITVTDFVVPQTVDMGLPSGTLWADRNLGAVEQEYEGLQFESARKDVAAEVLGSGWRSPSPDEVTELYKNCDASYEEQPCQKIILTSKINGNSLQFLGVHSRYWTNEGLKRFDLYWDYSSDDNQYKVRYRFGDNPDAYGYTCRIRPVFVKE